MSRDEVLSMDVQEIKIAVAEHIFKAQVITKQNEPDSFLLVGYMPEVKPLDGTKWQFAKWRTSEERAWEDCPNFGEDVSAAWKVLGTRQHDYYIKRSDNGMFEVVMDYVIPAEEGKREFRGFKKVIAQSAPEAISKCALLAVLDL
jgi:hypothetical protein